MGGGFVTRPNFDMPQASREHPMTEFYLLLAHTLERETLILPGAYVSFHPPVKEKLFEDTIRDYCSFCNKPRPGYREIFSSAPFQLQNLELHALPDGTPSALILTGQASHLPVALQLIPPFCLDALPPMPDCARALSLALTEEDIFLMDTSSARLGQELAKRTDGKQWLRHPAIDRWLTTALSVSQREYRRRNGSSSF